MRRQATWIISASIQGILGALVAVCVLSFLCRIVAPEAFGVHPAVVGIVVWGGGIALGILHARPIWKKSPMPQPRGFEVIQNQQPKH